MHCSEMVVIRETTEEPLNLQCEELQVVVLIFTYFILFLNFLPCVKAP